MKISFAVLAIFASICLLGQSASGFSLKTPQNNLPVALSECNTGYDCENKTTIKRTTNYIINLKESLNVDSNDKKPFNKKGTEAKPAKKTTTEEKIAAKKEKFSKKLNDDLKKKFEQIKKRLKKDSSAQKVKTQKKA